MPEPRFTDADTIRILVATDNHVGYEERDPIRGDDSWKSFDEIMNLARTEDVDMILLAGDLFHDNKPSRKAMYKVMRSLRKNCLGNKPCELQFLSDATDVFDGGVGHVNYEDPDINISIPVFSIHGNHDDPSGEGNLCSLDLLQMAGLVNYFGRVPQVDDIHAKPVLLQKGLTKLALYGISNVRDERMFRNFRDHNVKWYRPNQQSSDWFNLLAVHQNHHAHTSTGYLPENMLPEWLDLVVWGHEHECLIDPSHNPETGFHVMQPGSSVATSLVPGEAVAKHVAILKVTGKEFETEKHRLKSVRPFMTTEIVLANDKRFKGLDKKKENRHDLTKKLMEVVEEMIEEANAEWESIQEEDSLDNTRPLPLIRLKVEYTAPEGGQYDIENPQRFSNRFQGKVANTNDVVHFYRKKTAQRKAPAGELPEELLASLEDIEDIKVDKLVAEFLSASAQMKILPQAAFGDAVTQFVEKQDIYAMDVFVKESLSEQVKQMLSLGDDDDDMESAMEQAKARLEQKFTAGIWKRRRLVYKPKPDDWDSDLEGNWEDAPQALDREAMAAQARAQPEQPAPQQPKGRGRKAAAPVVEEDDEDMEDAFEEPAPKPKGRGRAAAAKPKAPAKAPARKAPARGRGKKAAVFEQSDEDEEEEEDVVMDDDDFDPPPPPPPKRAAPARATRAAPTRSQTSRAASTAAKSTGSGSAGAKTKQSKLNFASQKATQDDPLEISDDEISDDFEAVPVSRSRKR